MLKKRFYPLILVFMLASCQTETIPLQLADVFSEHMVLQAHEPLVVWGQATPGRKVSVRFRDQELYAKADADGKWQVQLEAEDYGDAATLQVTCKGESIQLNDILMGELWLCSGQSNMEMPLKSNWAWLNNAEQEIAAADYPEIRLFTVYKNTSFQPLDTMGNSGWLPCDSSTVKDFSCTAYFFGRALYEELQVPIGLIHSSWGGTVAEAWTSAKSLLHYSDFAETTARLSTLAASRDSLIRKYEADMAQKMQEVVAADAGFKGEQALWADVELDDTDWIPVDLPAMWEADERFGVYDGSTWYRKSIQLTAAEAKESWTLQFGAPDDHDQAWVNGVKVGGSEEWNILRSYPLPEASLKAGRNVLTLRVYDSGGGGGFMGEASDYVLLSASGKRKAIDRGWVAKKGFDMEVIPTKPVDVFNPNQPTVLYNAMIHPFLPLKFKGVIWYQGESNVGKAHQYQSLFPTLIQDWRNNFNNGDFPFYFVQIANYMDRNTVPVEHEWAELREAQTMALSLPNTGMAVTIDIGDAKDIHPGNKQEVGRRLAIQALANTYEKVIPYSGPLYQSYAIKGKQIELSFTYAKGLQSSDGKELTGFALAGADRKFVWAKAKVVEDKVVVWSPQVAQPVAVRYAWSANPACNLVNAAGLPASPFRTDDFPGITE